jgi:peptidoglycan/LPS O-acetylase OafA/YrhL
MGIIRFLLAMLVVYSHTFEMGLISHNILGMKLQFWWGAFSVGVFYMISGYYMEKKLAKISHLPLRKMAPMFYLDRGWRIYPTYLVCFMISLGCFLYFRNVSLGEVPLFFLVMNLLIIPTTFYYLIPGTLFQEAYLVIPVTPSLGVEEVFFLLFPFIFRFAGFFAAASALVFASSAMHWTDAYLVSYIGVPGTMFLFLTGSLISKGKKAPIIPTLVCSITLISLLFVRPDLRKMHLMEVASAYLVGIGILLIHAKWADLSKIPGKISLWLGSLSYSIFLLHWIAVEIVKKFENPEWVYLIVMLITVPVSLLESRIQRARRAYFARVRSA